MKETISNIPVYLCDPEKNKECEKTLCQKECFFTIDKKFSRDGKKYYASLDAGQ